ncbi:MAG: hypothetical protein ACOC04_05955 [Halothece sp.]
MSNSKLGKHLTLEDFCTCSKTYRKYKSQIVPYPTNPDSIAALTALNQQIIDPIIDHFGKDKFWLTYGFCSVELKRYLTKKDSITGQKNGRIAPQRDQHMAHEKNRNGKYYCDRLGAACDFFIEGESSDRVIHWILSEKLPFDSLYFYGSDRPIHISYGPQHKRDIWAFTEQGTPTKKGIEAWGTLAKEII